MSGAILYARGRVLRKKADDVCITGVYLFEKIRVVHNLYDAGADARDKRASAQSATFASAMNDKRAVDTAIKIIPMFRSSFSPHLPSASFPAGNSKRTNGKKHNCENNSDIAPRQADVLVKVDWRVDDHPRVKKMQKRVCREDIA